MQQVKNIVKGPYEPQDNTVIWIDTSNPDAPIAKVHSNGEWKAVSGVDNLPTVLNEIVDSLAKQASSNPVDSIYLSPVDTPNEDDTEEQAAVKLGLTIEQLRALFDGKLKYITVTNSIVIPEDGLYICIPAIESNGKYLYFYKGQEAMNAIYSLHQGEYQGEYYYSMTEY